MKTLALLLALSCGGVAFGQEANIPPPTYLPPVVKAVKTAASFGYQCAKSGRSEEDCLAEIVSAALDAWNRLPAPWGNTPGH